MTRKWHHFSIWEDYKAGMWKPCPNTDRDLEALAFMRADHTDQWGKAMMGVALDWRYACEHNLSHEDHNRQAWLGQAAVCYALGIPESVTRRMWWQLTEDERNQANAHADYVIDVWEVTQCRANQQESMF